LTRRKLGGRGYHAWISQAESALQQVFRVVVVSKLTYASPAWWGFTTSTDRQRIDGIFRRANKSGLWTSDSPTFEALW